MQVFSIAPAPKAKRARLRGLRSDGSGASCCLDDPGFEMTLTLMEMFNSSTIRIAKRGQPSGPHLAKNFSAVPQKAEVVCDYSHLG
jgi:hypothetical protein